MADNAISMTLAEWTAQNPVVAQGTMAYVTDTDCLKIGDGILTFLALPYFPTLCNRCGGGDLDATVVDPFTLSGTDITNKYVVLSAVPLTAAAVLVTIEGNVSRLYAIDYVMLPADGGKRLSWSGLGLDGVLVAGDVIAARYTV